MSPGVEPRERSATNLGFSNRSIPSATRITAGVRLSYRIIPTGTPSNVAKARTWPSRNDSCAWLA